MSFLIDQECFRQSSIQKYKNNLAKNKTSRNFQRAPFQNIDIQQQLKKMNLDYSFIDQKPKTRQYRIVLKEVLFGKYDLLLRIELDYNNQTITQRMDIIKQSEYFKISNLKQKLLSLRELIKNKYQYHLYIKPVFSSSGKFQIQLPYLHFSQLFKYFSTRKTKQKLSDYILFRIRKVVTQIKQLLKALILLVKCQRTKQAYQKQINQSYNYNQTFNKNLNQSQQKNKFDYQIRRFLTRSSIDLLFDCTQGSALYQKIVNISIREQEELYQMIGIIESGRDFKIKNIELYQYIQNNQKKVKLYDYFTLDPKQRQSIKIMLQFPIVKKSQNLNQNKYIFNNIKIFNQNNQNHTEGGGGASIYKLAQGGFGTISIGQFSFWYQNSISDQQLQLKININASANFTLKYLLKKYLIVKSSNQSKISIQKLIHQKQIVSLLKCGSSTFIPKYYSVMDRQNKFHNCLLLDYIQCGSLANFICNSQKSLSLLTVLHIMTQVAQGLRYLNQYKIVHLDLKPQNILLSKGLGVKLIDFGDAYNPQICSPKDNYRPGYTYPYGCPEIFDKNINQFSDKSDSFSIGIILFELIYGKYPISTSQNQLIKDILQKKQKYTKRIYLVPEQLQNYGQGYILPMINQLILKCLDSNVHMRPSLNWISVLLRKFLDYILEY